MKRYLTCLEKACIHVVQIPDISDVSLLKIRGIGKKGLRALRAEYGEFRSSASVPLVERIETALTSALRGHPNSGKRTIRTLSRMVAAYYG